MAMACVGTRTVTMPTRDSPWAAEACDDIDSDRDGTLVDEFEDMDDDGSPDATTQTQTAMGLMTPWTAMMQMPRSPGCCRGL